MHLALSDLYRARWSDMIHDEWIRNVQANRPDLSPDRLEKTRALMNHAVRDCLVTGFEYLIPSVNLPDPDDRHVVAAAIHSGASLIVTFNLKDFPVEALKPYNLAAQHPDDFIVDLLDLHPAGVLEAAANHRRSLKSPSKTADEYLDTLLAQGLTQTVAVMRQWTVAI
jgi:cytosine/adenosine deaminase-related metal-dependent hydrolase